MTILKFNDYLPSPKLGRNIQPDVKSGDGKTCHQGRIIIFRTNHQKDHCFLVYHFYERNQSGDKDLKDDHCWKFNKSVCEENTADGNTAVSIAMAGTKVSTNASKDPEE